MIRAPYLHTSRARAYDCFGLDFAAHAHVGVRIARSLFQWHQRQPWHPAGWVSVPER